ncbi:MAG: response regulator, partial [Oscillochloris sp.]|nr:response regulator [Oscillochloris sp.]
MSYRLVVVATEHATLRTLAGQLGESVQVALFDNANDALWEVQDNPPEVLITENDLPGMSGMDLAEILPNFELPTKVLIWSEDVTAALNAQAAEAGVFRVLAHGTNIAGLRAALEDAVSNARVAAAEAESRAQAQPSRQQLRKRPLKRRPPLRSRKRNAAG